MLKIDESTEYRVQREMRAERNAKFSIINSQLKQKRRAGVCKQKITERCVNI